MIVEILSRKRKEKKEAVESFKMTTFSNDKDLIIMGRFMSKERLPPIHPGEILLEEFLKLLGGFRFVT